MHHLGSMRLPVLLFLKAPVPRSFLPRVSFTTTELPSFSDLPAMANSMFGIAATVTMDRIITLWIQHAPPAAAGAAQDAPFKPSRIKDDPWTQTQIILRRIS